MWCCNDHLWTAGGSIVQTKQQVAVLRKGIKAYLSNCFLDPSCFLWPSPSKFPLLTGQEDWNDLKNQFTWKRQRLKSIYMSIAKNSQKKRMTETINWDEIFPRTCHMISLWPTSAVYTSSLLELPFASPRAQSRPHSAFQPRQGNTCWQKKQLTLIFLQAGNFHIKTSFASSQESK